MTDIALLGECMLELSPSGISPGHYVLGVAGDTYNTGAALARLGCRVEYLTGLGEDRHSDLVLANMQGLAVGSHWISRRGDATPGLYLIDNDASGERFFSYWRKDSAAHRTLRDPGSLLPLLDRALECPRLMFSGITLALCGDAGREALQAWLQDYRSRGGQVIYDGNYRASLWASAKQAGEAHRRILDCVDIFLPGVEDEFELRGIDDRSILVELLSRSSCGEIVLKDGPGKVLLWHGGPMESIAARVVSEVVDTTGAGDSFNGGYLAGRITGCEAADAARFACETAARTIGCRGAILPEHHWDTLREQLHRLERH